MVLDMQQPSSSRLIANIPILFQALIRPKLGLKGMTISSEDGGKGSCKSSVVIHDDNHWEPVMGIEPMTTVLPRLCATAAPHGPILVTSGQ